MRECLVLMVLVLGSSLSARASAACVEPPVELLWSYPADGDSDVPIDAQLQLVLSAKLYGTDWDATLNGEPIPRSADGAFAFGPLAADTEYTFQLEGHQPRATALAKVVELHFRTGSRTADAVEAPAIVGPAPAEDTPLCERVDARYVCRDTAPAEVRALELEQPNAVAWIDDAGNLWPRGCYPRLDLQLEESRCFDMHAVSADGRVSEATAFCAGATGLSEQAVISACAVAAVGGVRHTARMPAALMPLAFALCRCRRRS